MSSSAPNRPQRARTFEAKQLDFDGGGRLLQPPGSKESVCVFSDGSCLVAKSLEIVEGPATPGTLTPTRRSATHYSPEVLKSASKTRTPYLGSLNA